MVLKTNYVFSVHTSENYLHIEMIGTFSKTTVEILLLLTTAEAKGRFKVTTGNIFFLRKLCTLQKFSSQLSAVREIEHSVSRNSTLHISVSCILVKYTKPHPLV